MCEQLPPKAIELSAEQIEILKGPKGPRGERGQDGKSFVFDEHSASISSIISEFISSIQDSLRLKFEDLDPEQRAQIKGEKGDRGRDGKDGENGASFSLENSREEISSIISEHLSQLAPDLKLKFSEMTEDEIDSLRLKFDQLTEDQKLSLKGDKGPRGQRGKPGERGVQGEQGVQGAIGPIGP